MKNPINGNKMSHTLVGQIEYLSSESVSGWVLKHSQDDHYPTIEIFVDGHCIGTALANVRQDPARGNGFSTNSFGFRFPFPAECLDDAKHSVDVRIQESGASLLEAPALVQLSPRPPVEGAFEHLDDSLFVSGWAWAPDHPSDQVLIEVLVNGARVKDQRPYLPRPDLIGTGIRDGEHGFKIALPHDAFTSLVNSVEVLANGIPLPGGPKVLSLLDDIAIDLVGIKNSYLLAEVRGWPGTPPKAEVFIDGQPAGQIAFARRGSSDRILTGHWRLSADLRDSRPHVYWLEIQSDGMRLRTDPKILRTPDYRVHVDHADDRVITGWVVQYDMPGTLRLGVFSHGSCIGEGETYISRPDVESALGLPLSTCGFSIILNEPVKTPCASLELRDLNTGIVLAAISLARTYQGLLEASRVLSRDESLSSRSILRTLLAPLSSQQAGNTVFSFVPLPLRSSTDKPMEIDVIIPVYGGAQETAECITSVLRARNNIPARFVIVNDCSPDPLIREFLADIESRKLANVVLVHRSSNGGFSEAVNLGMIIAGDRDVILLNADTVVQDWWIDRIAAAAAQDPRIGTVTPFSNNGEICTVPYICKSLPINGPDLARAIDDAAAAQKSTTVVDLPVGIGFCMFLRRECINEIGLFDAATWGRGYGEEVDFCLKAAAHGWRNVLAPDVFVVHRGSISFGSEKLDRIMESSRKISERYPFYDATIRQFIEIDPIRPYRRSLNIKLLAASLPANRIVHVTHALGGGTEQYVQDIMALGEKDRRTSIVIRLDADGSATLSVRTRGTMFEGFFESDHKEQYFANEWTELQHDIQALSPERVHIHAPLGARLELLDWLTSSFSCDISIHDYAWICPRITLSGPDGSYCGEPSSETCNACVATFGPHPSLRTALRDANGDVAAYRSRFRRLLGRAETVLAPATDVKERLQRHGFDALYQVVPHPIRSHSLLPFDGPVLTSGEETVIRVGLFGAISDIKGYHLLVACAEAAARKQLPIQFIVFGYTMNDSLLATHANITVLGKYEDCNLDDLVIMHRPHLAFFPNQVPETFSYTLSHCFRLGLWPLVTDIGAPAERVRQTSFGDLIPTSASAAEILDQILKTAVKLRAVPVSAPTPDGIETMSEYLQGPTLDSHRASVPLTKRNVVRIRSKINDVTPQRS